MADSQHNILSVRDLSISFPNRSKRIEAVKNLSFDLPTGKTLGIVGESGSGKSLTALSIMRLLPKAARVDSGKILFQPSADSQVQDLLQHDQQTMRGLRGNEFGMIFQEPMTSLNPVFTCGHQVSEVLLTHQQISKQEARNRTIELFKKVELPRADKLYDAYPHEISGGQKQRVMIAMAMSCEPAILIADEPTTALDVTVQQKILELIQQLQEDAGMSVIFITHDLGVVAEIADQVVVMNQGQAVEQNDILSIFSNPQHPYTKGLLACRPSLDMRLHRLPTIEDFADPNTAVRPAIITEEQYKERQQKLQAQPPLLEVQGLKTWFPVRSGLFRRTTDHVKAVDGVDFKVYPGETLGLVGESGCGKTTLGRSLLRLIEPTEGEIRYQGKSLTKLSDQEMRATRKELQIIFQDPYSSLNPRMTVGQAILEPMEVHNIGKGKQARIAEVKNLLHKVGLMAEHYHRYPHEFSGGQRQRVSIARVLAVKPSFIICDESVSALDVSVQAQVLNLLKSLQAEMGLTYIFISHDLSVVRFMSDRLMVMQEGRIVETGYSEDIYLNPQTDYTRELISAIPKGELSDIRAALDRRQKVK